MIIAGTGHRPERIEDEQALRKRIAVTLRESRPDVVISGMAAGFDLILADEAIRAGIPVWAARPWAGHKPRMADHDLYYRVLDNACKVVNVDHSYEFPGNWAYQRRNEFMVDSADKILAYYDGGKGGTLNCLLYARRKHKPVRNLYEES